MKKFYQKEWYGIYFDTFASCNTKQLPGKEFYELFYKKFFSTYKSWNDLKPQWVKNKTKLGQLIFKRIPIGSKTLSIGCGIGLMEKYLYELGMKDLEINEVNEAALIWIKKVFPSESIHLGASLENVGSNLGYDYIYISAVDYCFNEADWSNFIKTAKSKLNSNGRCLVLSASVQQPCYHWSEVCLTIKSTIRFILSFLGIYDLGQFWGWRRTPEEHHKAMTQVGFIDLKDGYWKSDSPKNSWAYWIEGSVMEETV